MNWRKALFIAGFAGLTVIADQIKVFSVWGAPGQFFTLFQFFGPIAGAFLGNALGVASVLLGELVSFVVNGKEASVLNLLRLLPMLFAAYYFASKENWKASIAVPVAAILLFLLHPVGKQAFFFTGFWFIPVIAHAFFKNNYLAKSFGASFTAHAVGSVVWLYLIPTTPEFWAALIPVVCVERTVFSAGIFLSFFAVNYALAKMENRLPRGVVSVNKQVSWFSFKA